MGQLADLQVDEHIAAEEPIAEHQIDEEVLFGESEALLADLEEEAPAEFPQKVLDVGDDRRFQVRLGLVGLLRQTQKLEDVRLLRRSSGFDT